MLFLYLFPLLHFFSQKLRFAFAYVLCAILTDCLLGGVTLSWFEWFDDGMLSGFDWSEFNPLDTRF